jgi:hypothetical protein
MQRRGGVPERPKGTGCKPVGSAYGGSNPPAPTPVEEPRSEASLRLPPRLRLRQFESSRLHFRQASQR